MSAELSVSVTNKKQVANKWLRILLVFAVVAGIALSYFVYGLYQARTSNAIAFWQLTDIARDSTNNKTISHQLWQQLLDKYLRAEPALEASVFDYQAVNRADKGQLERYINELAAIDPRQYPQDQQFAYWANLYNALTVNLVLDHYPIDSIREIHQLPIDSIGEILGPWDIELITIAGQGLTLNQIEHGILRALWQEPRVHYVINCASRGCPDLLPTAINDHHLEQQLNQAAQTFINHPRAVDLQADKLTLSSIYNWFAEDFGEDQNALLNHLSQYAKPELQQALMKFNGDINYQYNWQLNQPLNE